MPARPSRLVALVAGALAIAGCAAPRAEAPAKTTAAAAASRAPTPSAAPREPLVWADLDAATLARAKRERKYVLLDGSAEWCHWCHVMEATTYHDPAVRRILDAHFVAVKVDVDARPDVLERYGDWGWPATIVFSPDAEELGKYRGYVAPETFAAILEEIVASGVAARPAATAEARPRAPRTPLSEEHLAWIARAVERELDDYWDEDEGGWGRRQKAAIGGDNAWMLRRAESGDADARAKILFTLDRQSRLLDPVWGGIYQYSAASTWDAPHFEKLMTFQAPAIDNYAVAYRLTRDPKQLARAKSVVAYVDRFLRGPEGGFYATQDADLNAHDRSKPFLDGHAYYALGERERLARGVPRVDAHEYGRENGLAIAAYCMFYEVTKDPAALASAERAARRVLATHVTTGLRGITHDVVDRAAPPKQAYLADNAAFGFALVRLWEVTGDDAWLARGAAIADAILADFTDEDGGGLVASTKDPDAVGVFATRRVPFDDDVTALRMLARLARSPRGEAKHRVAIDRVLRAISTPDAIKARGRWLGDYLLALEETKGVRGAAR